MTQQNPNQNPEPNNNPEPPAPAPVQQTGGVQTPNNDGTIDTGNANDSSAAGSSAEDTLKSVIAQSQDQVAKLIEQNQSLQSQIEMLLRNGATINDNAQAQAQAQEVENMTLDQFNEKHSENYVSLSDLGAEIGKREYKNVNIE